jgi:DNA (cytosine-5)-methyltransferase 1
MIGVKVNIKAYQEKGKLKKQKGFSEEETLLTHYDTLSRSAKKIAINYFKEKDLALNGLKGLLVEEAIQEYLFEIKTSVPFPGPEKGKEKFTFIDLFAGIGGFRIALQELKGKCVFSSEWDEAARETYRRNYGEIPFGDITKESVKNNIPKDFDILCGGFPCQPFSRAGVSARNFLGLEHGFDHPTQGNLFFEIIKLVQKHKPKVLFLENVKNLRSHDGGNTFKTIEEMITGLGYSFFYKIINAQTEIPQRRERTYMVCFKNTKIKFEFPEFKGDPMKLGSIIETKVSDRYTISDNLWIGHQKRSKRNKDRGTGFTTQVADLNKPSNTIVARYYKDGKECLIPQVNDNPRMLTEKECVKLFGFPDDFIFHKSRNSAYKQFGNSVAVPVIKKIAVEIIKHLNK